MNNKDTVTAMLLGCEDPADLRNFDLGDALDAKTAPIFASLTPGDIEDILVTVRNILLRARQDARSMIG